MRTWESKYGEIYIAPIPAGSIFTISEEEYSSYRVLGVFTAREDLDPPVLRDEYDKLYPKEIEELDTFKFTAWLVKNQLIEQIDAMEWHLGCAEAGAKQEHYVETRAKLLEQSGLSYRDQLIAMRKDQSLWRDRISERGDPLYEWNNPETYNKRIALIDQLLEIAA